MKEVYGYFKAFAVAMGIGLIFLALSQCIGCTFECPEDEDTIQCRVDSECDDDNNCTADTCSDTGECVHVYLPDLLCPEPDPEPEPEPEPETEPILCLHDADGDGFGIHPRTFFSRCPEGFIELEIDVEGDIAWDCDDENDGTYPGADELCDGVDNNCNGEVDEGCEEETPEPEPTLEVCDGVDNDGDGEVDEYLARFGCIIFNDKGACVGASSVTCHPIETSRSGVADYEYACDRITDPSIRWSIPQTVDTCGDGLDNNCDGEVDEGCEDEPELEPEAEPEFEYCCLQIVDDDGDGEFDFYPYWSTMECPDRELDDWICRVPM